MAVFSNSIIIYISQPWDFMDLLIELSINIENKTINLGEKCIYN